MKKTYETPRIEVVKFQYRDQVVVASGSCEGEYKNIGSVDGTSGCRDQIFVKPLNQ